MNREEALKILGAKSAANLDDIKKAFRAKILEVHPDVSKLDKETANKLTIEVFKAYELLTENPLAVESEIRQAGFSNANQRDFWVNSYYDYRDRDILADLFLDQSTKRYEVLIVGSSGMHAVLYHQLTGPEIKLYIPKPEFQSQDKKWDIEKLGNVFESLIKERGFSKEKTKWGWDKDPIWGGWIFKKPNVKSEQGNVGDYNLLLETAHFVIFSPMEYKDENLEYIIREKGQSSHNFRDSLGGDDHF